MENIDYLRKLVFDGVLSKKLQINDIVLDRLNYELSVIEKLDCVEYFTIYAKIIEICNKLQLLRSYGRGSACGSLVNYCLDITKLNPLEERLIFEKFLNPEFSKIADIDIDVPSGSQKKIIEILKSELPKYFVHRLAYLPPNPENTYKKVSIHGTEYRIHPCAIIISKEKILLPIEDCENETFYVSNDIKRDVSIFERFKFDILELETFKRLDLIWKQIGFDYHPYNIPLTDRMTFDFFKNGDLTNIFQFNTPTMKSILSRFMPNSINDLSLLNAMYRPGPLENIPALIHNKLYGYENMYPSDLRVQNILQESYGMLVYQETFMRLLNEIAGFSYIEADIYKRQLIFSWDEAEISHFRWEFEKGCKANSDLNTEEIGNLSKMILEHPKFSFQKSHTLCYSTIAYWCAFYKTHFEIEFERAFNF